MKFKILTLFPEMFPGPINHSITGKALRKKKFQFEAIIIRDFTINKATNNLTARSPIANVNQGIPVP